MLVAFVMCLSMLNLSAFATEEPELICGLEEHTHTEACRGLICGLEESEDTDSSESGGDTNTDGGDTNTDGGDTNTDGGDTDTDGGDTDTGNTDAGDNEGSDTGSSNSDGDNVDAGDDGAGSEIAEDSAVKDFADISEKPIEPVSEIRIDDEPAPLAALFQEDEEPAGHRHSEECYGLTCGKEEHSHSEACYETKEPEAPEEPEPPVDSKPAETAEDLFAAFEAGEEAIVLGSSFSVNETIAVTSDVVLDLNGQTLTWENQKPGEGSSLFRVEAGGALTVTDSSEAIETFSCQVVTSTVTGVGTTEEAEETRSVDVKTGRIKATQDNGVLGHDAQNAAVIAVIGGTLCLEDGIIDGNHRVRCVLAEDSGRVYVEGGAVMNGKALLVGGAQFGNGIYVRNGSLNMTGGVIADNNANTGEWYDEYRRGGGIALKDGSLDISGGIITNNRAGVGGGICAEGGSGSITIDGEAVIAENTSSLYSWGGGIAANGSYQVTVGEDALISRNSAQSGGGGIMAENLTVTGGQITGNFTETGGGGGISTSNFTMTDGIVAGNTSEELEGGGIRINGGGSEITGGYVTNNVCNTTQHWGGGGIFVSQGASIKMRNLLVTDNTAQGLGGGVAGCSTGQVAVTTSDGLASFANTAVGDPSHGSGSSSAKRQDQAALNNPKFLEYGSNDYFCAHTSYVSDGILGGGSANWYGSWDNGNDYQGIGENTTIEVAQLSIPRGGFAAASHLMGLSASPSEEDIAKAEAAAKVFVTGNESNTHGGGIMCNGVMFIGAIESTTQTFSSVTVEAAKQFRDISPEGEDIPMSGGEFTFALVKEADFQIVDGKPSFTNAQPAVNDENGKVLFTINDLKAEGEYLYYLVEVPGTDAVTVYDPAIYKIVVKVSTHEEISWEIDTKLTAIVYSGEVESILPVTVGEDGTLTEEAEAEKAVFTNVYSGELTVRKVWAGDTEDKRPKGIQVQLYKDGAAEGDPVTLDGSNDWSYTWKDLSHDSSYTVEEVEVPEGYTSSATQHGGIVTITNTYQTVPPEKPKPDRPTPDRPHTPDPEPDPDPEPGVDIPDEEPPLVDLPDEEPPLANIPEEEPPLVEIPEEEPPLAETPLDPTPKTGDNSRTGLWAALCGFSLFGMLALLGKKREDEES